MAALPQPTLQERQAGLVQLRRLLDAHTVLGARLKALLSETVEAGLEPDRAQMDAIEALTLKLEGIDATIEGLRTALGVKIVSGRPPSAARN